VLWHSPRSRSRRDARRRRPRQTSRSGLQQYSEWWRLFGPGWSSGLLSSAVCFGARIYFGCLLCRFYWEQQQPQWRRRRHEFCAQQSSWWRWCYGQQQQSYLVLARCSAEGSANCAVVAHDSALRDGSHVPACRRTRQQTPRGAAQPPLKCSKRRSERFSSRSPAVVSVIAK